MKQDHKLAVAVATSLGVAISTMALLAAARPARASEAPAVRAAGAAAAGGDAGCPTASAAAGTGELPSGQAPADFTSGAEACGGNGVALWVRGTLSPPPQPGGAGPRGEMATLRGRFTLAPRWWMTGSVDLYTHAFAGDPPAAVGASTLGIFWGKTSIPERSWWGALGRARAFYLRVLMPTAALRRAAPALTGAELGVSNLALHLRWFATQASFALAVPAEVSGGRVAPKLEVVEILDAWVTGARIAASAGAGARTDVAGGSRWRSYTARASARAPIAGGLWLALGAELPLPGSSTGAPAVGSLYLGWSERP